MTRLNIILPHITPDLLSAIAEQVTSARVCKVVWGGKTVWVKKAIPSKVRWLHQFQGILGYFNPMLKPTFCQGGAQALREEGHRLQQFLEAGIFVPQVVGINADYLVTSDIGSNLRLLIEAADDAAKKYELAHRGLQALLTLHQQQKALSTGLIRDLTYNGAQIGYLDFEEDPLQVMPLEAAQARNIILFLFSLIPMLPENDIKTLWQLYKSQSEPKILRYIDQLKIMGILINKITPGPDTWYPRDLRWGRSLSRIIRG
jgi:hypothetical protein